MLDMSCKALHLCQGVLVQVQLAQEVSSAVVHISRLQQVGVPVAEEGEHARVRVEVTASHHGRRQCLSIRYTLYLMLQCRRHMLQARLAAPPEVILAYGPLHDRQGMYITTHQAGHTTPEATVGTPR